MTFAKQGIASEESTITYIRDWDTIKLKKPDQGITEILRDDDKENG